MLLEMSSLSLYSYVSSDGDQATPVALSVVEGEKPLIGQEVTFAFFNPFSEHRDEAAEYLADAWALERKEDMIMLSPEMNEPVLNSYYEENLRNIDIWNLRGASVPMDKLAPKLIRRAQKKATPP